MNRTLILLIFSFYGVILFGQEQKGILNSLQENKFGAFSLDVQFIAMTREKRALNFQNNYLKAAASGAIIFTYESKEYKNLTLGLQFISSKEMLGLKRHAKSLEINKFDVLNHLYLKYDLDKLGFAKSNLTIGRQRLNTHFSLLYNIRYKEQAFEALVLKSNEIEKLTVSLGHITRFSNWQSSNPIFKKVRNVDGVSDLTKTFQFIDLTYVGLKDIKLGLYNLYGKYSYNITGLHLDYTISKKRKLQNTLKFRYLLQTPNRNVTIKNSLVFQLGNELKYRKFTIEPGVFITRKGDMKSPFQPDVVIEEPMYEADFGFEEGAVSYYARSIYNHKYGEAYFLYLVTNKETKQNREFNFVYSHFFSKKVYVKFKTTLIHTMEKASIEDYRIFIGYKF